MRKLFCMLMMTLLLAVPALAEDVCTIADATAAAQVTTGCSYLRVECPLPEETNVVLTVQDEWGTLIYQRDYGVCAGAFRSRDIHLPVEGETCDYTVTLATGAGEYTFIVTREQPLLTDSAVYAGGMTLSELNGGSTRKYAVVLDLAELNGRTAAAPLLSGDAQLGEALFTVKDGVLTVSAVLSAEGQLDKANVYVATDALTAQTLGAKKFTGTKTRLDREIPLNGADYVAVMVQLTVSYDPATAQPLRPEDWQDALDQMRQTWINMQTETANEAVG